MAILRIREIGHQPLSRNELPLAAEGTEGQLGFLNLRSGGEFWEMVAATAGEVPTAVWFWQARLLLTEESGAALVQGLSCHAAWKISSSRGVTVPFSSPLHGEKGNGQLSAIVLRWSRMGKKKSNHTIHCVLKYCTSFVNLLLSLK